MRRRDCLLLAGAAAGPSFARAGVSRQLAAAWARGPQQQLGVLSLEGGQAIVVAALDVPTRAHALMAEAGGSLLAVARRPGDWLLRWDLAGRALARQWAEPQRCFNGHVLASRNGRRLFTTETDLDSGRGLIGVRDAASLEKTAEWPTHGLDPHQLLLDDEGHLLVANGGLPLRAETGRMKLKHTAMDASLVRLHGRGGALLGQWRLADPRLSPRHLAWGPRVASIRLLGVALQAEHDDAITRAAAPVLALFDGKHLAARELSQEDPLAVSLAGYGGDIAFDGSLWTVSCPRANALARWRADGRWLGALPAAGACALAHGGGALWVAGREITAWPAEGRPATFTTPLLPDNHWLLLPPT